MENYIFSNDFYKSIDLMVFTSGHEKCVPSHHYGPAVRTSYLFHYIHSGKGIYKTHGQTFHLKAGDIFLIKPQEDIYYEADKEDPWEYSWIGLKGLKAEEYLARSSIFETMAATLSKDSQAVKCYDLLESIDRNINEDLQRNAIAYSFVFCINNELPKENSKEYRENIDYAEAILSYIEQNFDRNLTVQEISDYFALDRSYIHRIFKKRMNMSVKEYILSLRMATACSYLIYTSMPIADIARSVGYEDVLYFSKIFKKKKNCSPSEYRKNKQSEKKISS